MPASFESASVEKIMIEIKINAPKFTTITRLFFVTAEDVPEMCAEITRLLALSAQPPTMEKR